MSAVKKEKESQLIAGAVVNQETGVAALLRAVLKKDGRSFEDRLADAILRRRLFVPLEIREMAEAHLYSYGRDSSVISLVDFAKYRARVLRELLGGKPFPAEMSKCKRGEIMFFGAVVLLLRDMQMEDTAEYSIAKYEWNGRVQRHCWLA